MTDKQFKYILANCGVRDDARLLAKVAFGIRSPRITALGLPNAENFGILSECDFNTLVNRFEEECKTVGYKNKTQLGPGKKPSTKAGTGGKRATTAEDVGGSAGKKPKTA